MTAEPALTSYQQTVWDELSRYKGRQYARPVADLSYELYMSERKIRSTVQELRQLGYPVASAVHKPFGYYVPANAQEADECQRHLKSRLKEQALTVRALVKAFAEKVTT